MATDVTPRLAATTILVRSLGREPEVLLMKRGDQARFMPNVHVFAGGALDAADESAAAYGCCRGLDDAGASRELGLPSNGLRFFIAAIREVFEECGLLLAYDTHGELVDLSGWDESSLQDLRRRLSSGTLVVAELCLSQGWKLAPDQLHFFSHWITPPGRIRFDTRFFLGAVPPKQNPSLVGTEMSELVWRTAEAALKDHVNGRLLLRYPTRVLLQDIAEMRDVDALFDFVRTPRTILPITPDLPPDVEP
jgi:8-oxo-dGTP pyrophosphatase MutT (NUDIX family)